MTEQQRQNIYNLAKVLDCIMEVNKNGEVGYFKYVEDRLVKVLPNTDYIKLLNKDKK